MQKLFYHANLFKIHLFLLAIFICIQGMLDVGMAANDSRLSARLSTTRFSVDQTAVLSITVDGTRSAQVRLPEQEGLIFHRRGQSSKMQVINGTFSSSVTITYVIEALKEGRYTIPPLSIAVDNEVLKTDPLSFEVVSAAALTPAPGSGSPVGSGKEAPALAFMVIEGLPTDGYRGQILPLKIKAYFREGIQAQIDTLPQIVGASFVLSPLEQDPAQTKESHNGVNYLVVSWQASTSAIKEGSHSFQISLDANLLIPKRNSRSRFGRDPFLNDDLFSGFFDSFEKKKVTITSPPQTLAIAALPQKGRPADFNGAIGSFSLTAQAKPTEIEEGEPITLTISVSGTGNFDRVTAPDFPADHNWKTYSPVSRFENQNTSYQGKKIFEQAVVPTTSTLQSIPALSFSYFDPALHNYVTASTDPIPVTITGQVTTVADVQQNPAQTSTAQPQLQPSAQSAIPLKQHLTTRGFTPAIVPVYQRAWFIISAAICSCILGGLASLALRRKYLARNHKVIRQKQRQQRNRAQLIELKKALDLGKTDDFLVLSREIIQNHLGYLWHMEPSAITLYDLRNRQDLDSPLLEIFTAAQQHAYGGGNLSREEMQRYYTLLETTLEDMK
jgi:hypothetical protein